MPSATRTRPSSTERPAQGLPPAADAQSLLLSGLLAGTGRRCPASFAQLYRLTHRRSFAAILRINGSRAEAEELCQEHFLKVWSSAGQFDPEKGNALAWLNTMARNTALSSLRAQRCRPRTTSLSDPDDEDAAPREPACEAPGPDERLAADQLRRCAQRAVATLPSEQRECVHLVLAEGLSHQELADRAGRPLGTVKTWMRRSYQALRTPMLAWG